MSKQTWGSSQVEVSWMLSLALPSSMFSSVAAFYENPVNGTMEDMFIKLEMTERERLLIPYFTKSKTSLDIEPCVSLKCTANSFDTLYTADPTDAKILGCGEML